MENLPKGYGYPKVGVCAVIRSNGKILFGKRISDHAGGTYAYPGGKLEYLEDPVTCIRREIKEETGLDVGEISFWCITNDLYPEEGRHYITLVYFAEYLGGEPIAMEPTKNAGWGWYDWKHPPRPLMPPCQKMIDAGLNPWNPVEGIAI